MRLAPEDWKTRIPGITAVAFGLMAGMLDDFVFGPPGNRGAGSFLMVFAVALLGRSGRASNPRRHRLFLVLFALLAPALFGLIDPTLRIGDAYLLGMRQIPLAIAGFLVVHALDRRVHSASAAVVGA
jgi:hypothetical protein